MNVNQFSQFDVDVLRAALKAHMLYAIIVEMQPGQWMVVAVGDRRNLVVVQTWEHRVRIDSITGI